MELHSLINYILFFVTVSWTFRKTFNLQKKVIQPIVFRLRLRWIWK